MPGHTCTVRGGGTLIISYKRCFFFFVLLCVCGGRGRREGGHHKVGLLLGPLANKRESTPPRMILFDLMDYLRFSQQLWSCRDDQIT